MKVLWVILLAFISTSLTLSGDMTVSHQCDTSGIAWREKIEHLYSPGEPRPVSFSVKCRTVQEIDDIKHTRPNTKAYLAFSDSLAAKRDYLERIDYYMDLLKWRREMMDLEIHADTHYVNVLVCDTFWNYPVEYEAVIHCDTTGWKRYYNAQTLEGTRVFELKENQDVNAEIFRVPIVHCDTLYRRKP